ncbi:MAG: YabP/YqfC family sporulation protein [Clostridia bacterium]|nr:YabP/YqfC family sporulation protein [Clostridia bacterium]
MAFEKDVSSVCNLELATLLGGYKCSVFSGKAVVVEGLCGIIDFSTTCIKIALKKGQLWVCGNDLSLCQLQKGLAIIKGAVSGVSFYE